MRKETKQQARVRRLKHRIKRRFSSGRFLCTYGWQHILEEIDAWAAKERGR